MSKTGGAGCWVSAAAGCLCRRRRRRHRSIVRPTVVFRPRDTLALHDSASVPTHQKPPPPPPPPPPHYSGSAPRALLTLTLGHGTVTPLTLHLLAGSRWMCGFRGVKINQDSSRVNLSGRLVLRWGRWTCRFTFEANVRRVSNVKAPVVPAEESSNGGICFIELGRHR